MAFTDFGSGDVLHASSLNTSFNDAGKAITRVTQTAHGFIVGNPIRWTEAGSDYQPTQADSAGNAEVLGIISASSTNTFNLVNGGGQKITLTTGEWDAVTGESGGLTENTTYNVAPDSLGMLTNSWDFAEGQVIKPVLNAISTTEAFYLNFVGVEVAASTTSFYQDITGGTSTDITHNFGHSYVGVEIWNKTDSPPTKVTNADVITQDAVTPSTKLNVDLTSFPANTYRVILFDQGASTSAYNPRTTYAVWHTVSTHGSTNTKIPVYTTNSTVGDDVVVSITNSAADGLLITVNMDCLLSVTSLINFNAADHHGISLNSSSLTTTILSIASAELLAISQTDTNDVPNSVSTTFKATSGDLIRPHTTGGGLGATTSDSRIYITALELTA